MRKLNKQDYFSVRTSSLLSQTDVQILLDLYQPMITAHGVAIYATLSRLYERREQQPMMSFENFFHLTQLDHVQFSTAIELLEGIGLIKTFHQLLSDSTHWVFELYSPKYPQEFFHDPILSGLLKKYIGETLHLQLQSLYLTLPDEEGYEEVTRSFLETYHPDLNDPNFFAPPQHRLQGKNQATIVHQFDQALFEQHMQQYFVKERYAFTAEDMQLIAHYVALSGIDETAMAEIVSTVLQENQFKAIAFDRVLKLAAQERQLPFVRNRKKPNLVQDPKTNLGQKINLMESTNPIDFLRYVQQGTQPTGPDIKLVNDLSLKQGLSFPVINALIDYVLQKKNNTLPRAYVEKIASTLAREQIVHAIDAMDFLMKIADQYKGKS
jgi:replication initiation and membrane attachment protein